MDEQPKRRGRPPKVRDDAPVDTVEIHLLFPAFVGERYGVPAKMPAGTVTTVRREVAQHLVNAGVADVVG